jgi:hypothetical protein
MMRGRSGVVILCLLTSAILMGTSGVADAQPEFIKDNVKKIIRKTGVHLNTSYREPVDEDVTQGQTFGVSVGLSPGQTNGWRFPFGLSFFSEHLLGSGDREFARLRARALLGGIGYGWHFGKLSTGASLQAGYADYALRGEGDVLSALDLTSGAVTLDAHNSWLVRPQLKAEYFLTRKLTVRVSGDYVLTHPDIIVTTPAGPLANRWDASNFHANIGLGIYPFHK